MHITHLKVLLHRPGLHRAGRVPSKIESGWIGRPSPLHADGIAGLSNLHSPGRLPKLTEGQKAVLKLVVPAILHPAFVHARDPEGGLEELSAR
jgi:hypothetical protein